MISRSTLRAINARLRGFSLAEIPTEHGDGVFDLARASIRSMPTACSTAVTLERQEVDIALQLVEHAEQRCFRACDALEAENEARNVLGLFPLPRPWERWSPRTAMLDPLRWRRDGEGGRLVEVDDLFAPDRAPWRTRDTIDRAMEQIVACPHDVFVLVTEHVDELLRWWDSTNARDDLLRAAANVIVARRVRCQKDLADAPLLHAVESLAGRLALWVELQSDDPIDLRDVLRFAPSGRCYPHGWLGCRVCRSALMRGALDAAGRRSAVTEAAAGHLADGDQLRFSWAVVHADPCVSAPVIRDLVRAFEAADVPVELDVHRQGELVQRDRPVICG